MNVARIPMIHFSKNAVLILLACLCVAYFIVPSMADTPSSSAITVEVLPNGDAHWTTLKMIPLGTAEDIAGWNSTATANVDSYRVEFEAKMKDDVDRISATLGRPMQVRDLNVTVELSGPYDFSGNDSMTYGIIKYDFNWTGFAKTGGNELEIGDAFIYGVLLDRNDTIDFILPHGYTITSVSPAYDDIKDTYQPHLIWAGLSANNSDQTMRLFSSGEPSITLTQASAAAAGFDWMLIPVALASAGLGFGAAYFLLRRHAPPAPIEIPSIQSQIAVLDAGLAFEPRVALTELHERRYMSDEEKIVMFLEEAGGQMFQSDLVKKTDFSKSKLSMVLSDLKEKGTIIKIKKGKENLIRLNKTPPPSNK